jgi:rhodanese-related sulfurtransferase
MSNAGPGNYAGDVSASAAWKALSEMPEAVLVDVRSAAEWVYVGVPVLTSLGKATILIEWDEFPTGELVPDFLGRFENEMEKRSVGKDAPVFFICRSGNRSRRAAMAAAAAGYRQCFNIEFGFEGRLDQDRHRGTAGSWKMEGLPWVQS